MVIRIPYGGGIRALEHHSESIEAILAHIPGLKVVVPSNPYDTKGLIMAAINDPDPVIFLEPKRIYRAFQQEIPDEIYEVPIGKVRVVTEGGDIIKVGDVVVVIDDGTTASPEVSKKVEVKKDKTVEAQAEEKGAGVVGEINVFNDIIPSFHKKDFVSSSKKKRKVLATPVARKMAKDLGVDITEVIGSGINGRVMKKDIQEFAASASKAGSATAARVVVAVPPVSYTFDGPVEEVELSSIRKTISNAVTVSKHTIPHAVMMDEFDVTDLVVFRKEAKETAEMKGIKLTYLPFIIKALSIALKEYPIFNSVYDKANEKVIYKKYYNVGIATDTDKGVLVPVIKGVDHMSILDIAEEMNELVAEARDHTISLDHLKGGTFSITNYGSIGSLFGTPIIKHPEVAILGVGKIIRKPVFAENGEIVARHFMPVSLGIDHRIIDGADAGRFANRLKELLADPKLLLMS